MLTPMETYHELGRQAACAHKRVMTQDCGRYEATSLFQMLWRCLDAETLQDHCDARAAFNDAFRVAYRGLPTVPPEAPAPAPAPKVDTVAIPYPDSMYRNSRIAPAPAPVNTRKAWGVLNKADRDRKASASAAACAAFFNAKVGA